MSTAQQNNQAPKMTAKEEQSLALELFQQLKAQGILPSKENIGELLSAMKEKKEREEKEAKAKELEGKRTQSLAFSKMLRNFMHPSKDEKMLVSDMIKVCGELQQHFGEKEEINFILSLSKKGNEKKEASSGGENKRRPLDEETVASVLGFIKDNSPKGAVSQSFISDGMRLKEDDRLGQIVTRLVKKGYIKPVGNGRATKYEYVSSPVPTVGDLLTTKN